MSTTPMKPWYIVDNIDEVDSPSLLIFHERVVKNIQAAIAMVGDVGRLRPHVKTHKNAETSKLMIEAGIHKFKCATIAEAHMLADCHASDVLISYQLGGPKIWRYIELIRTHPATRFSSLIDNEDSANALSSACEQKGITADVYLDLNIGMNRTGIAPGENALRLFKFCQQLRNVDPIGIHAYDGHQRNPDIEKRKIETDLAFEPVLELAARINIDSSAKMNIVAGGSPTFPIHAMYKDRECSPGTFIYWDSGYQQLCPEQPFESAAVLLTRVISKPSSDSICTDLGHKAVAAENDISKRISFFETEEAVPIGQSEEHLILKVANSAGYEVGQVLYALPYHICPTVALYDSLQIVQNNIATDKWNVVARQR